MEVGSTANSYYTEAIEERQSEEEPLKKYGGGSDTAPQQTVSSNGCFDCNICLDFAVDPVVTLCGHLYCWPCIYRWLQTESVDIQQCPVCKALLSEDSLVPLYGRGRSNKHHKAFDIPQRPNSLIQHRGQTEIESASAVVYDENGHYRNNNHPVPVYRHQQEHPNGYANYTPSSDFLTAPSSPSFGASRVIHSTAGGVLGGMAVAVLPWVFPNQEMVSLRLPAPNQYHANGGSLRRRQQEMEVKSSLHQIWVFLFCCAMICLLLF